MPTKADRVCYQDGWHYSVVLDADGNEVPGEKLVLLDSGKYRPATDADTESWHDRKHEKYATVVMEDTAVGLRVNAEEMEAIKAMLAERRGE